MPKVILEMSVTLDGRSAGPDVDPDEPMGRGGETVHAWHDGGPVDQAAARGMFEGVGAFVMGRRTFDLGEPRWGPDGAFGTPCVVLTHRPREIVTRGPTTFRFTDAGPRAALAMALEAAQGQDVCVMGGAEVARQFLADELIDEVRIHIAPEILGAGTVLFEGVAATLEPVACVQTPLATHLTYRVVRPTAGR